MELTVDALKQKITDVFGGGAKEAQPSVEDDPLPEGATYLEEDPLPEGAAYLESVEPPIPADPKDQSGWQKEIGEKISKRFLGTDVEDPVALQRTSFQISSSIMGARIGAQAGTVGMGVPGVGIVVNPVTGAVVGSVVGLILGTVLPESILQISERSGLITEEERQKLSLSPSELKQVMEGEVLLDLATAGGLSTARLTGRYLGRVFTGVGKEETALADAAAKHGVNLMPIQVGDSYAAKMWVAVAGRFPWVAPYFVKYGAKTDEEIREATMAIPGSIGDITSWNQISRKMYEDATSLVDGFASMFHTRYEDLWRAADELGTVVAPHEVLRIADDILKTIGKQTPGAAGGNISAGPTIERLRTFITNEILPLQGVMEHKTTTRQAIVDFYSGVAPKQGTPVITGQTLRQMDGLITKIEQEMATLPPAEKKFVMGELARLKQAAQADTLMNIYGPEAAEIAARMKALDSEFSLTMSQLFETSQAKTFGSVVRGGVRHVGFDEATRVPVDQLAGKIIKLDSPQAMEELYRIVSPETFKSVTARIFQDAFDGALIHTGDKARQFDVDKFASYLGLDKTAPNRLLAVEKALELSGSPLKVSDLQEIVSAARVIANTEIPNVSTFIARQAGIGGLRTVIASVVPGLVVAGGTAAYGIGGLIGAATFIGGGRLVSSIMANPDSARSLLRVLDKEADRLVRRENFVKTLRLGIEYMTSEEDFTPSGFLDTQKYIGLLTQFMDAFDKQVLAVRGGL